MTLRSIPIDVPSLLAKLYVPLQPLVRRARLIRRGRRSFEPRDVLLPAGYLAEVVCEGLTAPVHACFGPSGEMYVTESGHKSESPPRIYRVDVTTGEKQLVAELGGERWVQSGAATGAVWHDNDLYVANTDTILRINPASGAVAEVVTGLPGKGDHQTNHPVVGPDGKLYWGQGCVTNMGVVGSDNFGFEWLAKFPQVHDVPAQDITLAGRNYEVANVLGNPLEKVTSGAYQPFGRPTTFGQVVRGNPKASGAILRADPYTGDVETVAWGLRNPYGIAFHPDGRLFATEHGSDERGARFIVGDPDDFYDIEWGKWYGWPDFASGIPLTDPSWGAGSQNTEPVLADFPDPNPPKPVASFETHSAANGFDFSRSSGFGFAGQAFVAMFGDLAPITTARQVVPAGFKVVRVDPDSGAVTDFAVNRVQGPASKLWHDGFERPSHCVFGPDGSLYVIDFGEIKIAPEKGAIRIKQLTGAVWRIRRVDGVDAGIAPPDQLRVPFYPLQTIALLGIAVVAIGSVVAIVRGLVRRVTRR